MVESCVLMYHLNNKNPKRQARWMQLSICLQAIMVTVLFIIFPVLVVIKNKHHFGGLAWGYIALIAVLVAVEAKMIWQKTSIVKHAKNKASRLLLESQNDNSNDFASLDNDVVTQAAATVRQERDKDE